MDVGIHAIDLIRWMAGEFQQVEYTGDGTSSRVESEAEIRFRLQNGASGKVVASRTRELRQALRFTGTNGFIEVGLWGEALCVRVEAGKAFRHFPHLEAYVSHRPPGDPSFVDQLLNIVRAIRGEERLLVTGREGMAAVEVVCRAYSASRCLSEASLTAQ